MLYVRYSICQIVKIRFGDKSSFQIRAAVFAICMYVFVILLFPVVLGDILLPEGANRLCNRFSLFVQKLQLAGRLLVQAFPGGSLISVFLHN